MPEAAKIKSKEVSITPDNLRFVCGLNGFLVKEVAERMNCTSSMLHQVVSAPDEYPAPYERLCELLPRREL